MSKALSRGNIVCQRGFETLRIVGEGNCRAGKDGKDAFVGQDSISQSITGTAHTPFVRVTYANIYAALLWLRSTLASPLDGHWKKWYSYIKRVYFIFQAYCAKETSISKIVGVYNSKKILLQANSSNFSTEVCIKLCNFVAFVYMCGKNKYSCRGA